MFWNEMFLISVASGDQWGKHPDNNNTSKYSFRTFIVAAQGEVGSEEQGQVDGEALDHDGPEHTEEQHAQTPDDQLSYRPWTTTTKLQFHQNLGNIVHFWYFVWIGKCLAW